MDQQEDRDDYNTMDMNATTPNGENVSEGTMPNASNIVSDDSTKKIITIDEAVDIIGFGKFQRQILFSAGLCFMADSMEIALLSFLSIVLKYEWDWDTDIDYDDDDKNGDTSKSIDTKLANIASMMFVGSLLGASILGPLGDRIGRRPVLFIAAFCISFFGFMTGICPKDAYYTLLIIRLMVGFGIGGLTIPFDILCEFLPTDARGRCLMEIEYFWTAGSILVPIVAYISLEILDSWRCFVVIVAIPCLFSLLAGYFFVPESPRWLASKGRNVEALEILKNAAAVNGKDPNILFPQGCIIGLARSGDSRGDDYGSFIDTEEESADYRILFTSKWRKITLLLMVVWFVFAFGYYGTIMTITRIFNESGGDSCNDDEYYNNDENVNAKVSFDYAAILISSSAEIFGTLLVILFIDRIGRVYTQIGAYLSCGISVFLLCILSDYADRNMLVALAFIARIGGMAASSSTWVATAEIFSTEIRSTGHSATSAISKLGGFFIPYLVACGTSLQTIGTLMLVFHVLAALCLSQLPETNGVDLGSVKARQNEERRTISDYSDRASLTGETELI